MAPTSCVNMTVAPRIQCPAMVAFVASLLGAVLSFTCVPRSTKGASARGQAAPPSKCPQAPHSRMLSLSPRLPLTNIRALPSVRVC